MENLLYRLVVKEKWYSVEWRVRGVFESNSRTAKKGSRLLKLFEPAKKANGQVQQKLHPSLVGKKTSRQEVDIGSLEQR